MKEMVEGVKRRQSMGTPVARPSLSPRKKASFSLLAVEDNSRRNGDLRRALIEEADTVEEDEEEEQDEEEENSDKENGDGGNEMLQGIDTREGASSGHPAPAQTPQMDDLRHVFRAPRLDPKTPRLRGIFAQRKEAKTSATPTFEGMGELMATPAGYRAMATRMQEEAEAVEVQAMEVEMEVEPAAEIEEPRDELEQKLAQEPEPEQEAGPEPEPEPALTRSTRRKTPTPAPTLASTRTPRSASTLR